MTQPRARQSVTDQVREIVSALEEQIVLGWLMPRERLLEDRLTAQFSCKKHVIREALTELERMGLVERVLNKGAAVRFLSPEAVGQIYTVREDRARRRTDPSPGPSPPAERIETNSAAAHRSGGDE